MLSIEEWLYKLAQDKTTPAEILRILSKDSITIQYFIADTNCSTDVLEILDKNKYWLLRDYIAQHLNCPEDVLKKLSQNEDDYGIRSCVAKNPNCSVDILKTLSQDENWFVRWSVAENLNCSVDILKELSQDKNYVIRDSVAQNSTWQKYLNQNQLDREEKVC